MNFKGSKSLLLCFSIVLSLFEQSCPSATRSYTAIIKNEVGTQVLKEYSLASETFCAIMCDREITCVGYTWRKGQSTNCATMQSLHESLPETDASMHMKLPKYRIIKTSYPTSNYGEKSGVAPWILDCSPGGDESKTGILVGLASRSQMDDLDYMICADFPLLTIDLANGAFYKGYDNNSYDSSLVTAIYGNNQAFDRPEDFRYKSRVTVSLNPIWSDDCVVVGDNFAPFVWLLPLNMEELNTWRICPPQMFMRQLNRNSEDYQDLVIYCCTLKYV